MMALPPEDGSSFEFNSFRAIEIFARPPASVYSFIFTPRLCRPGMGVKAPNGPDGRSNDLEPSKMKLYMWSTARHLDCLESQSRPSVHPDYLEGPLTVQLEQYDRSFT